MFNQPERLPIVQEMIFVDTVKERQKSRDCLFPFQRDDFKEIFSSMEGYPVTIRLFDPPIHEFLPSAEKLIDEINHLKELRKTVEGMADLSDTLKMLIPELHE